MLLNRFGSKGNLKQPACIYKLPRIESPRFSLKSLQEQQNTIPNDTTYPRKTVIASSIQPHFKKAGFSASDYKLKKILIYKYLTYSAKGVKLASYMPTKVKPQQIGGTFGFFSEIGENLIEKAAETASNGGIFKEVAEAFGDLVVITKGESSNSPQIGGQTEIRFNKAKEEEEKEQVRKVTFERKVAQEQSQTRAEQIKENVLKTTAQEIASLNNLQTDYRGVMNSNGEINIYHKTNADRKKEEASAAQIQQSRAQKMSKQPGAAEKVTGENELSKGVERSSGGHFTTAPG